MTDTALDEKLAPCPFCGGRAERYKNPLSSEWTMVNCIQCGASAFDKKWNRRTSPSQVAPQPQAGEPVAVGYVDPADTARKSSVGEPLRFWCSPVKTTCFSMPLYASPQPANPAQVTDAQIEHMVQRFLGWRLPETFGPDAGIRFERVANAGTPYEYKHEPVGTNLFDYTEAKAMVLHMLEELPAAIGAGGQAVAEPALCQYEFDDGTIDHYAGCFGEIHEVNGKKVVRRTPLYLHPASTTALSHPHPADERVVEAASAVLKWLDGGCSSWGVPEQQIRILALSATEGR